VPLPDDVERAQQTRTPKGRCTIGWLVADAGRKAWDGRLDRHTGEVRLQRQSR
jgi:hypothetical protein